MRKTLNALACMAILAAPHTMAEGKSYKVGSFDSIEVDGAMNVIHTTGSQTSVIVRTPSGDYSDARITRSGDTLKVSRESLGQKARWFSLGGRSVSVSEDGNTVKVNGRKKPTYTVYVTSPELVSVKASQSSRFESQTIQADRFSASVSSRADVKIAGAAGSADLSASSSGEMDASGLKAGSAGANASSGGGLKAAVTGPGESRIVAASSGEVVLTSSAAASFVVSATSGADVKLSGACQRISVTASSGASVDARALQCVGATAIASSGADLELFAASAASANASSGADISFGGGPKERDQSTSSGGSVSFSG